jgi:hypothetical protein
VRILLFLLSVVPLFVLAQAPFTIDSLRKGMPKAISGKSKSDKRSEEIVSYRVMDKKIVGDFYFDPSDSQSLDDSVMVVVGSDGKRYKRIYQEIWVEWFGAVADDNLDDSYAFQKAINFAITKGQSSKVKCGGGVFLVKNLVIGKAEKGGEYSYVSFSLEGVGPAYDGVSISSRVTELRTLDATAFTLAVQHGANCAIKNISFRGALAPPSSYKQLITWTDSNWNKNGTIRDNQCSPHAGIVIDPFSINIPKENRYPGAQSFYTNSGTTGTSGLLIEGCSMRQYIAAIMVSASPMATNADNIVFSNGIQLQNKIFWATGQRQSRGNSIVNLYSIGATQTLINGKSFGQQTGTPPFVSRSSIAGGLKYVYQCDANFSNLVFTDTYFESVWSLGKTYGEFPVVFENCGLNINYEGVLQAPVLAQGGPIHFRGGYLNYFDNDAAMGFVFNNRMVTFDAITISGGCPVNFSSGNFQGVMNINNTFFNNTETSSRLINGVFSTDDNFSSSVVIPEMIFKNANHGVSFRSLSDRTESLYTENVRVTVDAEKNSAFFRSKNAAVYSRGNFLTTSVPVDYPNDIYSPSKTAIGWVSAVSGDTVKIAYPTIGLSGQTEYPVSITRIPRFLARCIGTVTKGSNKLTNVITSRLYMGYPLVGSFIKGTGIPAGARILSVAEGIITISMPAVQSAEFVEFYDAKITATGVNGYADTQSPIFIWYTGDVIKNFTESEPTVDYYRVSSPGLPGSSHPPVFQRIRAIPE